MAIDISTMKCDINAEPQEILQFKQHDNLSRIILLELTDEGAPLELNGCDAVLYVKKSDGTQVFQTCEILDAQYGQLKIVLKQQALACEGEALCEVVITGEDKVLTTRTFKIDVLPCVRDESAIESADDFTDLQVMLNGYATANKTAAIFESAYQAYSQSGGTQTFEQWLSSFKGDKGEKGNVGPASYFYVRYADSLNPSSASSIYTTSNGHFYIGFYSGSLQSAPTDPSLYSWARLTGDKGEKGDKGDKGDTGSKGDKGDTGAQGQAYYVHVRYADSDSPSYTHDLFTSPEGHDYFGIYSGTSQTAPTYPGAYVWAKFRGEKGETGEPGPVGSPGLTPYIGSNNNWYIGSTDTGVDARGIQGEPGITLVEYADRAAYETALSSGQVAPNELSFWGQG